MKLNHFWTSTSLVAQVVKHLHIMRETWVQSLGWEDLLEKEMATHSSILAWKIPWMEEPVGSQRVGHDWVTSPLYELIHKQKFQTKTKSYTYVLVSQLCAPLCLALCNPKDCIATQAPLSVEFSRQKYQTELPFPTLDLPDSRIEPTSPESPALSGRFFTILLIYM